MIHSLVLSLLTLDVKKWTNEKRNLLVAMFSLSTRADTLTFSRTYVESIDQHEYVTVFISNKNVPYLWLL